MTDIAITAADHVDGPPDKMRKLHDSRAKNIYRPRNLRTIDLHVQPERNFGGAFMALMSRLHIHRQTSRPDQPRPCLTRFSSDHENIAGNLERITQLRNTLPELIRCRTVYFDLVNNAWLVDLAKTNYIDQPFDVPLKIGRCPVYTCDSDNSIYRIGMLTEAFDVSPIAVCPDAECWRIAQAFPQSVGMRVNKWGHVDILYENNKTLKQGLSHNVPGAIGGMTWSMMVLKVKASNSRVSAGVQVAATPDEVDNVLGCVGLRIRRRGDYRDSWTTTTHAWMQHPGEGSLQARNLLANISVLARRSKIISASIDKIHGSEAEGRRSQSVLATDVYVAGTRTKMGTITTCYDPLPLPDSTLMFPLGLDHDLSLITGDDLPHMSMPPNVPRLENRFADPEEALLAGEVFLTRFNLQYGRWDTFTGHAVSGSAREALVAGMEYFWERRHVKVKRALIWRTTIDDTSVTGAPGSTLCIGNPSAHTCRAVLFQNYQSMVKSSTFWTRDVVRNFLSGFSQLASFKAGFLLPADIEDSEIVVEDESIKRRSVKTCLQDNDQKTPLNRAIDHICVDSDAGAPQTQHEDIAFLLLDAPDVDIDARAGSALQEAIVRNRLALVQMMLDRGASVQVQGGKYGGTVQAAVRSGNIEMLALLLGRRANVNLQGGEFGTALQAAAFLGQLEILGLLLESGANVNARGGRWGSVLNAAKRSAASGRVKEEMLRVLDSHLAKDVPVVTHERDDWKLSPGGWTWARPESWENVDQLVGRPVI